MSKTIALLAIAGSLAAQQPDGDWRVYGRDAAGTRFSPLTQITKENVSQLQPAWTFHTGEANVQPKQGRPPQLEVTPLVVAGTMYVSTPLGRVYALNAATGGVKWRFDAKVDIEAGYGDFANRGVSYWREAGAGASRCSERIFLATIDARLIALDARTGTKCTGFGEKGVVDLRHGLRIPPFEFSAYEETSPPAVVRDLVVVGSGIMDNNTPRPASGEVRAFDVRTGALRWTFDPVSQSPAYSIFWRDSSAARTGGANVWSVIVADTARGLVILPTTSPAPDYYGGQRLGENRFANSVVALRAATGEVVWQFQTVHHDLWDYDNAAPPALARVGRRPAVLQATKSGMLFVLDRETGIPIFPIDETDVPASDIPTEQAWPTQPHSLQISPAPQGRGPRAWGPTSLDSAWCQALMDSLRFEPSVFVPPSTRGTFVLPGNIGGGHWGGVAVDEVKGIAVVPVNTLAAQVQLIPRDGFKFDSVRKVDAARGLTDFEYAAMRGTPYILRRRLMIGPSRMPCTPPPFGMLVAVDLNQQTIAWRVPLGDWALPSGGSRGDYPPSRELGSVNLGGPIITASGLIFIGATLDRAFRAFDLTDGHVLWRTQLPAGARATPMTYQIRGRQYVAIAAGGGGPFGAGDAIIAFALPKPR